MQSFSCFLEDYLLAQKIPNYQEMMLVGGSIINPVEKISEGIGPEVTASSRKHGEQPRMIASPVPIPRILRNCGILLETPRRFALNGLATTWEPSYEEVP